MIEFTMSLGIIIIMFSPALLLYVGTQLKKIDEVYVFVSYILAVLIIFIAVYLLCSGVKKRTLIDYYSGKISYEVTDVDVEYNKVTNNRKKDYLYTEKYF